MAIRDRITQFVTYLVKQIKCSQGGILIGRVTGEGKAQEITVGSGLTLSGTTLSVTGGTFAAASHTHSFGSITGKPSSYPPTIGSTSDTAVAGNDSRLADVSAATSDASDVGTPGKLLKSTEGGTITIQGLTVKQSSYQISIAADSISGTDGVSNWVIQTAGGGTYTTPTGSGTLALTPNADGSVSYNDLVDVPTTVPLTSSKVVANAAARLHLTTEQAEGFAVVDADTGKTWMLVAGGTPATSSDWLQLGDRDITAADITDPENLFPAEEPIYGSNYGIVSDDSSDATATANAAALTSAAAAAASQKKTLILSGTIYIKGEWLVEGNDINIFGNGATIIQKDTAHNGITVSETVSATNRLIIQGINFTGSGASAHNAAGIRARRSDNAFFMSDFAIRDCAISGFRKGINVGGVVKLETDNLSITACRVCADLYDVQTSLFLSSRMSQGDSDANSSCFNIDGTLMHTSKILMGEFGGAGIARFAVMPTGWLNVESANLENFTADQVINMTGTAVTKKVILRGCRLAFGRTATQSIISSECNPSSGAGVPAVIMERNVGGPATGRYLEIWGVDPASMIFSPQVEGTEIKTDYCQTQGGTILQSRYEQINKSNRVIGAVARASIASGTDVEVCSQEIKVGSLNRIGQTAYLRAAGTTAANANNKQFKVKVGAATVADFGAIAMNNSSWRIEVEIMYGAWGGGSGNWKVSSRLFYDSEVITKTWDAAGAVGYANSTVSITSTTNSSGDVVKSFHKVIIEREAESY